MRDTRKPTRRKQLSRLPAVAMVSGFSKYSLPPIDPPDTRICALVNPPLILANWLQTGGSTMTKRITVEEAKQSLGKGKGTGKKGWFGSKARSAVAVKVNTRKD
jgi:hypothetical protein